MPTAEPSERNRVYRPLRSKAISSNSVPNPPVTRALSLPSARRIQARRWLSRVARKRDRAAIRGPDRPVGVLQLLRNGAEGSGAELLHPDLTPPRATPRQGDLAAVGREDGGREAPLEHGVYRNVASAAVHPDHADVTALPGLIDQRAVLGDRELHRPVGDLVLHTLQHERGSVGQPAFPGLVPGNQDAAVHRADGDEPRREVSGVRPLGELGHRSAAEIDHTDAVGAERALPHHHERLAASGQHVGVVELLHAVGGVRVGDPGRPRRRSRPRGRGHGSCC